MLRVRTRTFCIILTNNTVEMSNPPKKNGGGGGKGKKNQKPAQTIVLSNQQAKSLTAQISAAVKPRVADSSVAMKTLQKSIAESVKEGQKLRDSTMSMAATYYSKSVSQLMAANAQYKKYLAFFEGVGMIFRDPTRVKLFFAILGGYKNDSGSIGTYARFGFAINIPKIYSGHVYGTPIVGSGDAYYIEGSTHHVFPAGTPGVLLVTYNETVASIRKSTGQRVVAVPSLLQYISDPTIMETYNVSGGIIEDGATASGTTIVAPSVSGVSTMAYSSAVSGVPAVSDKLKPWLGYFPLKDRYATFHETDGIIIRELTLNDVYSTTKSVDGPYYAILNSKLSGVIRYSGVWYFISNTKGKTTFYNAESGVVEPSSSLSSMYASACSDMASKW